MKRLTLNRLALAGLRANRKEYRQMALGIFLAVFLAVGSVLGLWAMWESKTEARRIRFGQADGIFFRPWTLEPEALTKTGIVSRIGTVYVLGNAGDFRFGYYDEEAEAILNRQFLSGRMPESSNEVTLDENALESLCPGASLGDTVTLPLVPMADSPHSRSFVLCGIFRSHMDRNSLIRDWDAVPLLKDTMWRMPDILVWRDTPDFQDYRVEREYVFTLSPKHTIEDLFAQFPFSNLLGVDPMGNPYRPGEGNGASKVQLLLRLEYASPVLASGAALLLAAMIGIFDAASGQFTRKERQYRLLQAVGATHAQIRAVSRREALLLALLLAPWSALAALGFVKLCCRLLPDSISFSIPLRLVLGSLLAAFSIIWIAASLPALRAFRGGILENAPRKERKKPRRSRPNFVPARLLAFRNLGRHSFRCAGSVILIVLMNVTSVLFVLCIHSRLQTLENYRDAPSFWVQCMFPGQESDLTLTEEKLHALRTLPGISQTSVTRCAPVYALTDTVGDYLPTLGMGNYHLRAYRPDLTGDAVYDPSDTAIQSDTDVHRQVEEFLGTDRISIFLYLVTVEDASALSPFLQEGTVDVEAIDSGRSVLMLAPDYYVKSQRSENSYTYARSTDPIEGYDLLVKNDQFPLNSPLTLAQIDPNPWFTVDTKLRDADSRIAETKVGGIVKALSGDLWDSWDALSVITTVEGARSLGLDPGPVQRLALQMDGSVSDTVLESQISAILGISDDKFFQTYSLTNFPETMRNLRKSFALYSLFLGSLLLAFLGCTAAMLRGSCARDMQGNRETLSILEALGCEDREMLAIWKTQIVFLFLLALPVSVLAEALVLNSTLGLWQSLAACFSVSSLISLLAAALCLGGVGKAFENLRKDL